MAKKAPYGMTLDTEVGEKIREFAQTEDRSLSFLVNKILIEEIARRDTNTDKVEETPRQKRRIIRSKKEESK